MGGNLNTLGKYKQINQCIACAGERLRRVLTLKKAPLTDNYVKDKDKALEKIFYPIEVELCEDCGHLQLKYQVEPDESYEEYNYQSGITTGLSLEFNKYADEILKWMGRSDLQLCDIGSNDGSFLRSCKSRGMSVTGVEPARHLAEMSNEDGVEVICDYFGKGAKVKLASKLNNRMYDVITFNNVLANISAPIEAIQEACSMLKNSQSIIVIQTGYHPEQFQKGLFDYIYHEHYSYFSASSMERLAERSGLKIVNQVLLRDLRGGSVRWILKKGDKEKVGVRNRERFTEYNEYNGLNTLINKSKEYLLQQITQLRKEGYKIIGYGASHSTGILVHHFELSDKLDWLVDENSNKLNKYMPGTKLEVREVSYDTRYVYVILAWQYFNQIRTKLRNAGFEGRILKPILP